MQVLPVLTGCRSSDNVGSNFESYICVVRCLLFGVSLCSIFVHLCASNADFDSRGR